MPLKCRYYVCMNIYNGVLWVNWPTINHSVALTPYTAERYTTARAAYKRAQCVMKSSRIVRNTGFHREFFFPFLNAYFQCGVLVLVFVALYIGLWICAEFHEKKFCSIERTRIFFIYRKVKSLYYSAWIKKKHEWLESNRFPNWIQWILTI